MATWESTYLMEQKTEEPKQPYPSPQLVCIWGLFRFSEVGLWILWLVDIAAIWTFVHIGGLADGTFSLISASHICWKFYFCDHSVSSSSTISSAVGSNAVVTSEGAWICRPSYLFLVFVFRDFSIDSIKSCFQVAFFIFAVWFISALLAIHLSCLMRP